MESDTYGGTESPRTCFLKRASPKQPGHSRPSPAIRWLPVPECGSAAAQQEPALSFRGERASAAIRSPAGSKHKQHAGRQRYPKDASPGLVFEGEKGCGVRRRGYGLHTIAVINANQRGDDDAQREQPLEDSRAFAARRGGETFREVERNDNSDEAAADALQQTAKKQRFISVREGNHRNADDERDAAEDHEGFAPDPVGDHACKQGGNR